MNENKNLEQRLRRALYKLGYGLHKSRKRNWSYDNQCGYMVYDISTNCALAGVRFDFSLDDVSDWLECL